MSPILILFKLIKRVILSLFNKVFKLLVNFQFIRDFLISKRFLLILNFILRKLTGQSVNINASQIQNKYKKILGLDEEFVTFNKNLLLYFNQSNKAKEYKKLFVRKRLS